MEKGDGERIHTNLKKWDITVWIGGFLGERHKRRHLKCCKGHISIDVDPIPPGCATFSTSLNKRPWQVIPVEWFSMRRGGTDGEFQVMKEEVAFNLPMHGGPIDVRRVAGVQCDHKAEVDSLKCGKRLSQMATIE